jgi:D-alanyl-D-alanine carboxypeptidase
VENKIKQQTSGTTNVQVVYITCAVLFVIVCSLLATREFALSTTLKQASVIAEDKVETIGVSKPDFDIAAFENIQIQAQSYIVYDPLSRKIIASKNTNAVLPLASVTKVVTALVATKYISKDEKIQIIQSDLFPEGDSGLTVGDVWSRDELIKFMLSVSSNDGAHALARVAGMHITGSVDDEIEARSAFVSQMNIYAAENNLSTFAFLNESGLDISTTTYGGIGSVFDTAQLFAKAYFEIPELFDTTTKSIGFVESNEGTHIARNTNSVASSIPGLTASKTGYTDAALGNLGVVVEIGLGRPVVIVVLHSGRESRFSDVETLYKATVSAMK